MKSNREIQRQARQMFRLCLVDGRLADDRVRTVVARLKAVKPRGQIAVLERLLRLVRMEKQRTHAVVDCASEPAPELRERVLAALREVAGPNVTAEFTVNPGLLGGLRVRLGSHILDGSVKARLDHLAASFAR